MVASSESEGVLRRGFRMGKMGFQLTGSYLGYQLQNLFLGAEGKEKNCERFRRKSSRKFREELQSLKGPAMKMGQSLSMLGHLMPAELIEEMRKLQMQAPAMHPTMARAQFKASFGKLPEEVFKEFSPEQFAAASLGQVHRAVTQKGEAVVVKIQYPAMQTAIKNDFKLLWSAIVAGRMTKQMPKVVLEELELEILKETDYLNEGQNIDFFREKLSGLDYVKVPKVYWDLTTDRVLTMSFVEGIPLYDFLENKPTRKVRDQVGTRLLEMFLFQIAEIGAFHADPHPGNYLFTPDGGIGLVDFGCVKMCSTQFSELIRCFMEQSWLQGETEVVRMMQLMFDKNISPDDERARRILNTEIKLFNLRFPPPKSRKSLVSFTKEIFDLGASRLDDIVESQLVQPEYPLYSRAELGLYNFLHLLGARINTNELRTARCKSNRDRERHARV